MDKTLATLLTHGEFLIGDYTSKDLKSVIEHRPVIVKPRRKFTEQEVAFRSGTLIFDEKSYSNTPLELSLYFKASSETERNNLRDKITFAFDSGGYLPFIPYFDKTKVYLVKTTEPPSFSGSRIMGNIEKYTVSLTVKPFKELIESNKMTLVSGQKLNNPTYYPSKPVFEITGTGDVTLNVNGVGFVLKNIQGSVVVNSVIPSVYRNSSGTIYNEENKAYTKEYPVLKSGSNTISWTGSGITKVTVEPRWWTQ